MNKVKKQNKINENKLEELYKNPVKYKNNIQELSAEIEFKKEEILHLDNNIVNNKKDIEYANIKINNYDEQKNKEKSIQK